MEKVTGGNKDVDRAVLRMDSPFSIVRTCVGRPASYLECESGHRPKISHVCYPHARHILSRPINYSASEFTMRYIAGRRRNWIVELSKYATHIPHAAKHRCASTSPACQCWFLKPDRSCQQSNHVLRRLARCDVTGV